jgi:predicted nucleotidyltransferase component of viral defense system
MSFQIIQDRFRQFAPQSMQEEEHVIKQIYQEIALYALSRAGFFKIAAFQGGTCLRLVYGEDRFSEDLDFILIHPEKKFQWEPYLKTMNDVFASYDISLELIDRSTAPGQIQRAFLKHESFGKVLRLSYQRDRSHKQNLSIRLEIDANPPAGSGFSTHYLDFPLPFSLVAQDKPSLFASKLHALLCRSFLKGRDWYDFIWYVANKTPVNFSHLKAALVQTKDWKWEVNSPLTAEKLIQLLKSRIEGIDWESASEDVAPFLAHQSKEMLHEWSRVFFLAYLDKLSKYLEV